MIWARLAVGYSMKACLASALGCRVYRFLTISGILIAVSINALASDWTPSAVSARLGTLYAAYNLDSLERGKGHVNAYAFFQRLFSVAGQLEVTPQLRNKCRDGDIQKVAKDYNGWQQKKNEKPHKFPNVIWVCMWADAAVRKLKTPDAQSVASTLYYASDTFLVRHLRWCKGGQQSEVTKALKPYGVSGIDVSAYCAAVTKEVHKRG